MSEKVIQIVAATPGWRHVYTYLGEPGDLATLPDDHLYGIAPIACWALTEHEEGDWWSIRHVTPDDWPQYLAVHDEDEQGSIGYLGPGEEPDHNHREEAIRQITHYREREAARRSRK